MSTFCNIVSEDTISENPRIKKNKSCHQHQDILEWYSDLLLFELGVNKIEKHTPYDTFLHQVFLNSFTKALIIWARIFHTCLANQFLFKKKCTSCQMIDPQKDFQLDVCMFSCMSRLLLALKLSNQFLSSSIRNFFRTGKTKVNPIQTVLWNINKHFSAFWD